MSGNKIELPIVTIAILAGGQSHRMGTDKSFAFLHDKPVIEHVLAQVGLLDVPIILITNSAEKYAQYALSMFGDILPNCGSLGGLYTAIRVSPTEYTICVACDMPFLNVGLLRHLIDVCTGWDVVVPCIGGFPEAMHAVYGKTCLEPIQRQLVQGELKASRFYEQVNVRYVEEAEVRQFDPNLRSFINLNTPDDLAIAHDLDSGDGE